MHGFNANVDHGVKGGGPAAQEFEALGYCRALQITGADLVVPVLWPGDGFIVTSWFTAIPNADNATDKQNYSRYYPKPLPAEVLFDAVSIMTRSDGAFAGLPLETRAVQLPDNSFNAQSYFLAVFGRPESASACECERSSDASLAQSLHLLNSKDLLAKISADTGRAAGFAADSPGVDDSDIAGLYVLAFSREPLAEELALARKHLSRTVKGKEGKPQPVSRREAYEDILWALLNTKEFRFNH